jgi:hypothetical protein
MAHRQYLIHYSNGMKRHVSREERDLLTLEQIGPREYRSKTDLSENFEQVNAPHYLPGLFTVEFNGKRQQERLQTERGLIEQLERQGLLAST